MSVFISFFFFFFFFIQAWFSYHFAGLPLTSCWAIGPPSVGGSPQCPFCVAATAGTRTPTGAICTRSANALTVRYWVYRTAGCHHPRDLYLQHVARLKLTCNTLLTRISHFSAESQHLQHKYFDFYPQQRHRSTNQDSKIIKL